MPCMRLGRMHTSCGIAALALQHTEDDLTAADVHAPALAALVRALHEDVEFPGSLLAALAH